MAGRGAQTFKKRQKEQNRKERQEQKRAKRAQRRDAPATADQGTASPDVAGDHSPENAVGPDAAT